MTGRFIEKKALITGAAGGIGNAIAKALVLEGAHVALVDSNAEKLLQLQEELIHLGDGLSQIVIAVADLSSEHGVKSGINTVLDLFRNVDIFIANVGRLYTGSFESTPIEEWQASFAVNFFSHVSALQLIIPMMKSRHTGHIILMGSDQALQPDAGQSAYGQAKAALHHLGKTLARELPVYGIQTSVLAPGMTRTPLVESLFEKLATETGLTLPQAEAREIMSRDIPMRRIAEPEEIAKAVLFLAEVEYTNGSILEVSGGNVRSVAG